MPTVDELVVKIIGDASSLKKALGDAGIDMKKFKEESEKHGKDIDKATKNQADGFGLITKKLGELAAAYLSFTAVKSFVNDLVNTNVALNNTAAALGISTERLSAMGNMARMVGSSAQGMAGAIGSIQQQLVMMNQYHMPPSQDFLIGATMLGLPMSSFVGRGIKPESFLLDTARAAQEQLRRGTDPAAVSQSIQRMGITDAGMIAMLEQRSPEEILKYLQEMKKYAPSPADTQRIINFNLELGRMYAAFDKASSSLAPMLSQFVPFIHMVDDLSAIITKLSGIQLPEWMNIILRATNPVSAIGHGYETFRNKYLGGSETNAATPPTGPVGAVNRGVIAQQTANQMRAAGMPESGVAALLANIHRESGFNPNSRVADQPHFGGEAHYAHGLYQEGGTEWNNYASWLSQKYPGRSWNDPKLQNEFLMENLKLHYPKVWAALMDPNLSAGQKAMIFQQGYLRPAATHPGDASMAEKYLRNMPPSSSSSSAAKSDGSPKQGEEPWYARMWHHFWGSDNADAATIPKNARPQQYHPTMLHNQSSTTNNISSAETHIGYITVNTQATDARGIANSIGPMLKNRTSAMAANNISGGPV